MDYVRRLHQSHRIEVNGEAAYATAARLTKEPERRAKWEALKQLETQMKTQLAVALQREGTTARERRLDVWLGQAGGGIAAMLPWRMVVWALAKITAHTTRFWERLEREQVGRNPTLFAALTAHERAQQEFAQRELSGEVKTSLEFVSALLSRGPWAATVGHEGGNLT